MAYFTQDILSSDGVTRKQFYTSVGMQDFTTGEIVQTRQFVGEHTLEELQAIRASILAKGTPTAQELSDRLAQANVQVAEIDSKLLMLQ